LRGIVEDAVPIVRALSEVRRLAEQVRANALEYTETGDERVAARFDDAQRSLEASFASLAALANDSRRARVLDPLASQIRELGTLSRRLMESHRATRARIAELRTQHQAAIAAYIELERHLEHDHDGGGVARPGRDARAHHASSMALHHEIAEIAVGASAASYAALEIVAGGGAESRQILARASSTA